nr:MAG TPA: hypothetical protein [Caudoviricetes sp.]
MICGYFKTTDTIPKCSIISQRYNCFCSWIHTLRYTCYPNTVSRSSCYCELNYFHLT